LPEPVRFEVCGLLPALSLTLSFPVLLPAAVGRKRDADGACTLTAKLVVQVVADTAKSPAVEIPMSVSVTF